MYSESERAATGNKNCCQPINDSCPICLTDFEEGMKVWRLPCGHAGCAALRSGCNFLTMLRPGFELPRPTPQRPNPKPKEIACPYCRLNVDGSGKELSSAPVAADDDASAENTSTATVVDATSSASTAQSFTPSQTVIGSSAGGWTTVGASASSTSAGPSTIGAGVVASCKLWVGIGMRSGQRAFRNEREIRAYFEHWGIVREVYMPEEQVKASVVAKNRMSSSLL